MRILAISGSLRAGSHNTDLLQAAAAVAPDGIDVELYDGLKEIPPYDGDDDRPGAQPLPVQRLKRALDEAAGRQGTKPRRDSVRDAIASVRIEGGQVDEDATRILDRWAEGALSDDAMMAEILKPYAGRR